ncbi:MAG TPA: tRNA (adenosine(37)-N6)-threonylcarbamoyltransferase complex dimerization subunit type 1 TsaB, partial [Gammaproteobacteria bacterium]
MNLLAIETSAPVGSIAVQCAGKVSEASIATPREQTSRVLPLIDELLSAAGISLQALDGIAFGRGPGSFTGIRVATAVAQGLGLAAATPLLPVSCLAATAQRAWREFAGKASLVSLDARMGEVFWCGFTMQSGLPSALGIERLSSPRAVRW